MTLPEVPASAGTSCPFCDHEQLEPQLIAETSGFYLAADLKPLSDGHLLLIARGHMPCLGALEPEQQAEFLDLKRRASAFLAEHYGPCIFFEHGIAGQTVPHAHLHAIPGVRDFLPIITAERDTQAVARWADVHAWYTTRGAYLYYEQAGQGRLLSADEVPAGYLQGTLAALRREEGAHSPTVVGEAAARRLRAQWQHHQVAHGRGAIDVVACFLTRSGQVCLFKRSDRMDSIPGKWHTVSGYLPSGADPLRHALTEVGEETGLHGSQVALVATSEPVTIGARWGQLRWRIHPFAFEVREGEPTLNWEHVDKAWVEPHQMRAYDCVSWLPDLYARLMGALP